MSSDELKAMLGRITEEASNNGDYTVLDELLSPNFASHSFDIASGPQGYKDFLTKLRDAFPDFHVEVEDMVAEDNKVVSRGTISGTQKGKFMDIEATNKQLSFSYIDLWQVENDKFVGNWLLTDLLKILQQLGLAPESDAS